MGAAAAQIVEEAWSAGGLHGTIAKAADHTRGPAVLIVAGSGPTDRDGNGRERKSNTYRLIATALAANGILSLRYDKRGVAESRALVAREDDLVFDHFVDDAVAALQNLSARPDVSMTAIAGHSEGAIIAPVAAARVPVDGIALLAGPARTYLALVREQLTGRLPPDLDVTAKAILDSLAGGRRVAEIPEPLMALFRPSVQPFLISANAVDPAQAFAKLRTPSLIVHAGRDLQIAQADFDALRAARPDAATLLLQQANHMLKTSPADREGNLALYDSPQTPLDPGLMPSLIAFLRALTK